MPCSSGCCGSPTTVSEQNPPSQTRSEESCGDNGGDNIETSKADCNVSQDDGGQRPTASTPCQDACCGGPREEEDGTVTEANNAPRRSEERSLPNPAESCCAKGSCEKVPIEKAPIEKVASCCTKGSCEKAPIEKVPSCCEGKIAPCCDQSCLDRLALRDCENEGPTVSRVGAGCNRRKDGKPCAEHARKTRRTYSQKLEALGCICRALIALGQESCCAPQRPPSTKSLRRRIHRRDVETASVSHVSVDSCCAGGGADKGTCSARTPPDREGGNPSCDKPRVKKSRPASTDSCCAGSCCDDNPQTSPVQKSIVLPTEVEVAPGTDPEKGFLGDVKEHVILSISGMTCTGCETKLVRTLGPHPSVKSLKTSLILARVEFDLVGAASAVDVMKHLERTTEFKCERITNQGASLDLIPPGGNTTAFVNRPWPDGVLDVRIVDKKTVNVSFDAKLIGARDLVERGWDDGPMSLAPLRPDSTLEAGSKHVRHVGYMTLLSACLTIPVLVMAWAPLPERHIEYASASLALATLVQFVIAGPFYPKALKAMIFSRVIEMDLLVVLSTSAAYIFSIISFGYLVSGRPLSTREFFETSTLLVTLIMVGRWIAAVARQKAIESISIRSLQSPTACLVTDDGETEVDARLLQYGDMFKVAPDSRVPTDGTVVSGSSEVDESMITGESMPVEKHAKYSVLAGSVNGSGTLRIRLARLPGDNTISTIANMVDEAKLSKPKIQDLADRVASYFVPTIIVITIVTFCIWIAIGLKVRGQTGSEATIQAITYAITVLIVSCPCAIGLAVPMVIVVASGAAAERGVIFKSAESIEVACKTTHVVLDKTGTVTEGKLTVTKEWYRDSDQDLTKSLLLGLVKNMKHPVSAAVARHLKAQGVSPSSVSDPKALVGKGVEGIAEGSGLVLQAGNSRWLNLTSDAATQSVLSQGYTAFCFTIGGSVAAVLGLEDSLRPDAASTVKTLLDRDISVHMISGDDDGAVRSVAAQLNIAETNIRSRCTPADKQAYIQDLIETSAPPSNASGNAQKPVVIFCGDGTNDAVALAQATIGVHMNEGGTDVAQSAADVVLMRPNLGGILTVINVSKKSIHRIAFNFGWSFVYNLFAILLAAGAFVNARIPPEFAGLGELISVLPVIAAAMLLRWSKI